MNKSTKFILKLISNLIVIIAVALAILLVGLKFTGLQIYTVVSGSMEPTYHVGSLIYVKKVDPSTLKIKDPITFKLSDNTIATHRIIEIVKDEENPKVNIGVTLKDGYNGDISARDAGRIGGNMVRKMIQQVENNMANK